MRGIWRDLYGHEAESLPAYTRDWAEAHGRETLIEAAHRHLVEVPPFSVQSGDVLVFRWRRNALAKHCAILTAGLPPLPACGERVGVRGSHKQIPIGTATMIHALEGAPVSEVALSPWWRRHLAAAFMFPGVEGSDPAGLTPCETLNS